MKIYNYNESGEFIGASEADESPLELGVYLIPALATTAEPPVVNEGFVPVWNGAEWTIKDISLELPIPENKDPAQEKTYAEILEEQIKTMQGALDFIIMNY